MVKVSIEVHSGTARFAVAVLAKSIQHALSIAAARHPSSITKVKFRSIPRASSWRILLLERDLLLRS